MSISSAQEPTVLTTGFGEPVPSITASLTAGRQGPLLVEDNVFFDAIAHFDRERIPERVVHAKGAGKNSSNLLIVAKERKD